MTNWTKIGQLAEIPVLGARIVETAQGVIALFRGSDDRVFALHNRCPHRGGPLSEGIVHNGKVTCPLHSWVIDLESGQALAPDNGCTPTFPAKVIDGAVWLNLGPRRG